jgi:hypothetical protein
VYDGTSCYNRQGGVARTFVKTTMKQFLFATILGLALSSSAATAQTISDRIYDVFRPPGTPVIIGVLSEPFPKSVSELTNGSALILEAKVSLLRTYINASDTGVISEFEILPIQILAGNVPVETPLLLRTAKGEVLKDGVTVREVDHDRERLKENMVYLLFLKHDGLEPNAYSIYNVAAFEVSNNVVRPLAAEGDYLFSDFSRKYDEAVAQVMKAARAR